MPMIVVIARAGFMCPACSRCKRLNQPQLSACNKSQNCVCELLCDFFSVLSQMWNVHTCPEQIEPFASSKLFWFSKNLQTFLSLNSLNWKVFGENETIVRATKSIKRNRFGRNEGLVTRLRHLCVTARLFELPVTQPVIVTKNEGQTQKSLHALI